MNDLKLKNIID